MLINELTPTKVTFSNFSVLSFYHLTRDFLYTGHLPVPAGGHRYSGRQRDSPADAYAEGFQHSDLGPVLLLLHSSHRVRAAERQIKPSAMV